MRVENLSKPVVLPPTQYLQSIGRVVDGLKITAYFYPSMLFPNKVEILSATFLYKNEEDAENKVIQISIQQKDGSTIMLDEDKYTIKHPKGKLVSTIEYKTPVILDALQPFYFYGEFMMEDSCLVIGYRNIP